MTGITVSRRDDRLIAVKRSEGDHAERCRAEARLLARLEHPGLVPYVDLVEHDGVLELHTAYVGTDTWERTPPSSPRMIVEGLAAVASTVADLHDLRMTHRSLVPEHVIVGNDQRPILCGLADAAPFDTTTEADDMAGLAGLIRHLPTPAGTDLHARLNGLAQRAVAGELSARALTEQLDSLRVDAAPARADRRRMTAIAAAVAVVALGIGLAVTTRSNAVDAVGPTDPPPTAVTADAAAPPPTAPPTTTTVPIAATTDDAPALELVHEGRRYGLGRTGDIAVVGDWNCDGVLTPALLQPATETVALFNAWPSPESSVVADAIGPAPGATSIEAEAQGDCHRLRLVDPDGSTLFVPEIP